MLARQRQAAILDRVRATGGVRVTELATEFGVSDMTIRRDLDALHARGLLAKVHGGATVAGPSSAEEPDFDAKSVQQLSEKSAIAAHAARLVRPGSAVALSGGTTTAELARHLVDVPDLTVVTNSLPVAEVLHNAGRSDQTVILTGGIRTPSHALVGPLAVAAIRSIHVDTLFLGVHGISERAGLTTPNLMEAETNRALMAAADELVVLADHTKWGLVGLSSIGELGRAHVVVSDDLLPDEGRRVLAQRVGQLVIVERSAGGRAGGTTAMEGRRA